MQSTTVALVIENDGPAIGRTNFFDLPAAKAGMMFGSWHDGAIRLLLPDPLLHALAEMRASKRVLAWGAMVEGGKATCLMYDGGGPRPLVMWLGDEQFAPPPPLRWNDPPPPKAFRFLIYTSAGLACELPGVFGRPGNIQGLPG